ncbi:MAG TPA: tRNA (adenosine(37)-N6)-dimethylallyltransferase MiaA [Bacteroidales bacterium]|nr:tRNA (adenosine(37)-N6)-dimethylallyltransferase MiaA [Bacteroidales bacterium]
MNNILIVLLGPTGVGKTDVSIYLARHFGSDIISADSRQFFREMKTGTAVPSDEQLAEIKHHFIRFMPVSDYYSSSLFERDVLKLLPELFSRNSVVLMTGGSAMYIDAVCGGIDDIPDVDQSVREKYNLKFKKEGIAGLRMALKLLDPEHYEVVDLKNPKRIIRALEICETTGRPYSSFLTKQKRERDFQIIKIGLERPRPELYDRINRRVDNMVEDRLENEARDLFDMRHLNALNSVGYREFFDYFEEKITMERAIELIKRNSRRYAKRQMTWWAKDKEITWFEPEKVMEIISYIEYKIMS